LPATSQFWLSADSGLHIPFSKRPLACLLAFAAGSLISALAIELAYEGAQGLHSLGFNSRAAWAFVSTGFAAGAVIYFATSLFLEKKGAAVRYVTQFREYALARKHADTSERIRLLSACELMRHLPTEEIEPILHCVSERRLNAGEILFRADDDGDALYIVAYGKVEILKDGPPDTDGAPLAMLGAGHAFGEMALLSGEPQRYEPRKTLTSSRSPRRILSASSRPTVNSPKPSEQQSGLMLHRTRELLVRQRTALINSASSVSLG
jgi:hypothetical protein